jgi:hypothetical protein
MSDEQYLHMGTWEHKSSASFTPCCLAWLQGDIRRQTGSAFAVRSTGTID